MQAIFLVLKQLKLVDSIMEALADAGREWLVHSHA